MEWNGKQIVKPVYKIEYHTGPLSHTERRVQAPFTGPVDKLVDTPM